ncbi:hypothetical protein D3C81_415440 [compost metagenome]
MQLCLKICGLTAQRRNGGFAFCNHRVSFSYHRVSFSYHRVSLNYHRFTLSYHRFALSDHSFALGDHSFIPSSNGITLGDQGRIPCDNGRLICNNRGMLRNIRRLPGNLRITLGKHDIPLGKCGFPRKQDGGLLANDQLTIGERNVTFCDRRFALPDGPAQVNHFFGALGSHVARRAHRQQLVHAPVHEQRSRAARDGLLNACFQRVIADVVGLAERQTGSCHGTIDKLPAAHVDLRRWPCKTAHTLNQRQQGAEQQVANFDREFQLPFLVDQDRLAVGRNNDILWNHVEKAAWYFRLHQQR